MEMGDNVEIVIVDELTDERQRAVDGLQKIAFADVDPQEIKEDFYVPRDAHVLASVENDIVGYASIHHADVEFEGKKIALGGFGGVCTREDMQRREIATRICQVAMEHLKQKGYDLAFLSVDLAKGTSGLYEKVGFVLLPRKFSWKNVHGEIKEDVGGMIAPMSSPELFEHVLKGEDIFYVGNGYF